MQETIPSFEAILSDRFGAYAPLEDGDKAFFGKIAGRPRDNYPAESRLWTEGELARHPCVIVSGWACSARELAQGVRQISEILLPGDVIGFGIEQRPRAVATVSALTALRIVSAQEIASVWRDRQLTPRMGVRLEAMLAEQNFWLHTQIMRLGRSSAYGRIANLFCELHWRLAGRGLATESDFPLPLTQEQVADVVGLSVVHVNRTLQQLRREGRIAQEKGRVRVFDLSGLRTAGAFTSPVASD